MDLRYPIGEFEAPGQIDATIGLRVQTALYSWHGRHHLAHISSLAEREGWTG